MELHVVSYGIDNVGLEVGSIRRIQGLDTAYWGFLRAEIRRIFLDGYGVLVFKIMLFDLITHREYRRTENIKEAMENHEWIEAMQKELHQFDRLKVWELVDKPFGKTVINLKWLWKNKKDQDNIVIRNKARLVAKGYRQEEGIDFEESFAPVT
ncbi:retrovirus-related pol polyprotein from transposon TNT 1-94 [Tanacetum coccineum]